MECEHKGCKKEGRIIICDDHINTDYPPDYKQVFKDIEHLLVNWCYATYKQHKGFKKDWKELKKSYNTH